MANFENTSNGLVGCLDAMKKALEDGKTVDQFLAELSSDEERRGFDVLLTACKKSSMPQRISRRPGNDLTRRFPLIVETLARLRSPARRAHSAAPA